LAETRDLKGYDKLLIMQSSQLMVFSHI